MKTKQQASYFVTKRVFSRDSFCPIPQNKIFYFTHFRREFQNLSKKQQDRFIKDLKKFFGGDYFMVEHWERKLNIKL
jgi:hypothetical protein